MRKRFDELFGDIVAILRRDYVGADRLGERFDPRYYNQAVGQAWRDDKLDELLFLRYMSQMLACTGDRHLRISLRPSESYTPWSPGFFTRRFGDCLYVTVVTGETRLSPSDRIIAVNGGSPAAHRANIQKNFFYADTPEREDWNGLLKMAEHIDVEHTDGSRERIELRPLPVLSARDKVVPGHTALRELPGALILDLRNAADVSDDELFALLPRLCRMDTPLSALIDTEYYVNYTRLNCLIKAAGLQGVPGGEAYIAELVEKSGRGLLPESTDDGEIIPGGATGTVVVLTDTWTRDGAETLALAAKRAGAHLIGRPTLGTIDHAGDVHYALDERYTLTWPTAVAKSARDGSRLPGEGVMPDEYIPWTPDECKRDLPLEAAIRYTESNRNTT